MFLLLINWIHTKLTRRRTQIIWKKLAKNQKKINVDNQIPINFFSCWEKEKKGIQSVCLFIYLWKFIKNKKKMKKEKKTKYENKVKLYKRKVPIFITFWQKSGKILFDFACSGWISVISGVKNETQHMYFKFLAQRYGDLVLLAQSNIFFPIHTKSRESKHSVAPKIEQISR